VTCAATLLAEIGDCRARYPTGDAPAADGGQAAIAIKSGKRKRAAFRHACDHRLRDALACWPTAPATGTPRGRRPLRRRQSPRPRRPTRHPHARARLAPRPVALLATLRRLRPQPAPRPARAHRRRHPERVEPPARSGRRAAARRRGRHRRAAQRTERAALDGTPAAATALKVDTGRLMPSPVRRRALRASDARP
jgi:hypothetical protein